MKKIAVLLAAVMMTLFCAYAETAVEEPVLLEGVVLEILEDGYLVDAAGHGEVQVHTADETVFDANADILPGDYVYIDYSGMMTYSLPPQITASVIRMFRLEGEVVESDAEANTVFVNSPELGEVVVNLPEAWEGNEVPAGWITVYFNGAMTMSLPAQVSAGLVVPGYSVQGVVSEAGEGFLMIGEGMAAVQVNLPEGMGAEGIIPGTAVRVIYDGQMTRSIPAQITAEALEIIRAAAVEE